MTYTTNVRRGVERVRITATIDRGYPDLLWCERYVRGELAGCGSSFAGLGGDMLHDCRMRLDSLFDGSMLWTEDRP
jgi:hypothetical protein